MFKIFYLSHDSDGETLRRFLKPPLLVMPLNAFEIYLIQTSTSAMNELTQWLYE